MCFSLTQPGGKLTGREVWVPTVPKFIVFLSIHRTRLPEKVNIRPSYVEYIYAKEALLSISPKNSFSIQILLG